MEVVRKLVSCRMVLIVLLFLLLVPGWALAATPPTGSANPTSNTTAAITNTYVQSGTLLKDTTLEYVKGKTAVFKAGTKIEFFSTGYVKKGTVKQNTIFEYMAGKSLNCKAASEVEFDKNGYAVSPVLAEDTKFEYAAGKSIKFKMGTAVSFYPKGYVKSGTPKDPATVRYMEGQLVTFSPAGPIDFATNGNAVSGVLNSDAELACNREYIAGDVPTYKGAVFQGGTRVEFQNEGRVKSGTLRDSTFLKYEKNSTALFSSSTVVTFNQNGYVSSGNIVGNSVFIYNWQTRDFLYCKDNHEVAFNDDGSLTRGTIVKDVPLKYASNDWVTLQEGTEVVFNTKHLVQSGTLRYDTTLKYSSSKNSTYMAGTKVVFSNNSQVREGILVSVLVINDKASLKTNTVVTYGDDGTIAKGTLKTAGTLFYIKDSSLEFKGDMPVELSRDGYVTSGTVNAAGKLTTKYNNVKYPAGALIVFTNNTLANTTLAADSSLIYSPGRPVDCMAKTEIYLNQSGLVHTATIKADAAFEYAAGKTVLLMGEKEVTFNN